MTTLVLVSKLFTILESLRYCLGRYWRLVRRRIDKMGGDCTQEFRGWFLSLT